MRENLRLLDLDFDDDYVPHACAASNAAATNDDPFMRPDYRSKRNSRPIGRVVHKKKPRRTRVRWVEMGA